MTNCNGVQPIIARNFEQMVTIFVARDVNELMLAVRGDIGLAQKVTPGMANQPWLVIDFFIKNSHQARDGRFFENSLRDLR